MLQESIVSTGMKSPSPLLQEQHLSASLSSLEIADSGGEPQHDTSALLTCCAVAQLVARGKSWPAEKPIFSEQHN